MNGERMDLLKHMQLFARIVEHGNFSKAAAETGLTQPTISKCIAALEKHLGAQLLSRTTRQVRPTDIGNQYYAECRKIIEAVARSEGNVSHLRTQPTGLLKISAPMSFGRLYLVPRVVQFLEKHPGLKIDLSTSSQPVDLVREGFDLAIRTGRLADSRFIARRIGKNYRAMVATPEYLRREGTPGRPADLAKHNCILASEPWQLQGLSNPDRLGISGNLRVNNAEGVREAVLRHLGIGILPLWSIYSELQDGQLVKLLPKHAPVSKDIYAVYPYTRNPPSMVRQFIAFLEEDLNRVNYPSDQRRVAAK